MKRKTVGHSPKLIQNVFVLLLLSLFAILSTFLVTIGAQLYRNTVEGAEKNNAIRIVTTVVRNSIWAEDGGAGDIRIEKLSYDGRDYNVLSIVRQYGDTEEDVWAKRIYAYEGQLREIYTEYYKKENEDDENSAYVLNDFSPEYGEPLCDLYQFEPSIKDNMLTVKLETADHLTGTVQVYMRTGGAAE